MERKGRLTKVNCSVVYLNDESALICHQSFQLLGVETKAEEFKRSKFKGNLTGLIRTNYICFRSFRCDFLLCHSLGLTIDKSIISNKYRYQGLVIFTIWFHTLPKKSF